MSFYWIFYRNIFLPASGSLIVAINISSSISSQKVPCKTLKVYSVMNLKSTLEKRLYWSMSPSIYLSIHLCIYVCMYVCMYVYIYVSIYHIYIYTYIYIYIHHIKRKTIYVHVFIKKVIKTHNLLVTYFQLFFVYISMKYIFCII